MASPVERQLSKDGGRTYQGRCKQYSRVSQAKLPINEEKECGLEEVIRTATEGFIYFHSQLKICAKIRCKESMENQEL